ncbi:MAG TPA: BON domain-containing protein [Ramlibacter sp.]|nr:BON domain-containing protein [Ramlibacter sp.]
MKQILSVTAAFAAGAIAMYYLDSTMGRSRRALARDRIAGVSHDAADLVQSRGKRMAERAKGVMGRVSSTEPQSDAQLRERVRSRMDLLVSHPRAIEVSVEDGVVRLTGQVLAKELDGLLSQLTGMPGVRKVHNSLATLDDPSGFGEVRGQESAEMGQSTSESGRH